MQKTAGISAKPAGSETGLYRIALPSTLVFAQITDAVRNISTKAPFLVETHHQNINAESKCSIVLLGGTTVVWCTYNMQQFFSRFLRHYYANTTVILYGSHDFV